VNYCKQGETFIRVLLYKVYILGGITMNRYNNYYEDTIYGGVEATDEYFEDDALLAKAELLISPEEEGESIQIEDNMEELVYVE